jgi:FkbH-like protein
MPEKTNFTEIEEIRKTAVDAGFNDSLRLLRRAEAALETGKLTPLKIAVLRSYTAEMLEPVLKLRLMLEGFHPTFLFGDYNGYVQEILDTESPLYSFSPDIVLVLVRIEELMPDLVDEFPSKDASEWEVELRGAAERLAGLADTLGKRLPAQIVFQNMCQQEPPYFGVHDAQAPDEQTSLVGRFNTMLAEALKTRKNAFIWDYEGFVKIHGYASILDPKGWYTSKNPYQLSAYPLIAADITKYILSALGRVKKCVVVDLDNTLWGGIAGEDGMDGVAIGHEYPGSCFRDFQKRLLKLYHRGIILAINSKNNPEDALEIIAKHPDMILRRKHFAAMRINWEDKVSNMNALACDLNIGLDSMIFIDDNPAECALVRENCPGVEVVCLPEKPYLIPGVVSTLPCTDKIALTSEDRKKGEMYRAEGERKECEARFEDLEGFLAHLDIRVAIEEANGFTLPRIAQLTQKTNQMNLTTRRYTEPDIQSFIDDPACHVFSVSSKDRFGDNGIIGVCIVKGGSKVCSIDTFLLSCRVIGRRIEDAIMAFVSDYAKRRGAGTLVGEYIPTAKNKPASGMYERFGFVSTDKTTFRLDLGSGGIECPPFIKLSVKASI